MDSTKTGIEKLVRNGPGQRIRNEGGNIRIAAPSEMPVWLARKLVEEAQEVLAALENNGDHRVLVGELADVSEVMFALREALTVSAEELRQARNAKLRREGDFNQCFVWKRD